MHERLGKCGAEFVKMKPTLAAVDKLLAETLKKDPAKKSLRSHMEAGIGSARGVYRQ